MGIVQPVGRVQPTPAMASDANECLSGHHVNGKKADDKYRVQ